MGIIFVLGYVHYTLCGDSLYCYLVVIILGVGGWLHISAYNFVSL